MTDKMLETVKLPHNETHTFHDFPSKSSISGEENGDDSSTNQLPELRGRKTVEVVEYSHEHAIDYNFTQSRTTSGCRKSFLGKGMGLRREARPSRTRKKLAEQAVAVELALCDSTLGDSALKSSILIEETQQTICKALLEYVSVLLNISECNSSEDVRFAMKLLRQNVTAAGQEASPHSLNYALAQIYDVMADQKDDSLVQDRAINLIGKLSREKDWVSGVVAETGGVERVVNAMSNHCNSSVLQERGITTLLQLTTTEQARTAMVNAKGAESVCWAMKGFLNVKTIQVQGSTALCNMAFGSASSKKRIGKIGGIDGVVMAMESHPSDPDLQARCCLALRNLTCGSRVNQWIAGRACAMEAILRALDAFPDDVSLQYQGCVALANLCTDEPDNRVRAAECGVIEATLKTMKSHIGHAGIIEHSLALLSNLSVGNETNQLQIGQMGGVRDVTTCLRQHITAPGLLANGCDVLRHLMFARENRLAIYECGGLEVLVRVMHEGVSSRALAEAVIYALGNSAYDLPESKSAIGRYGGMAALVDLMSNHMDTAAIQEHGCRALRNLADSDDLNSRLLAESGAIDSCIFACSGYPENGRIQEHALAMLFNMAYSEENVLRMKGLDVERVTTQACDRHPGTSAVQAQGKALLEVLRKTPHSRSSKPSVSAQKPVKPGFNLGAMTRKGSFLVNEKRTHSRHQSSRSVTLSAEDQSPRRTQSNPTPSALTMRNLSSRVRMLSPLSSKHGA